MTEDTYYANQRREIVEERLLRDIQRELHRDNSDLFKRARDGGNFFSNFVQGGAPSRQQAEAQAEIDALCKKRLDDMKTQTNGDGVTLYAAAYQDMFDHISKMGGFDHIEGKKAYHAQINARDQLWDDLKKETPLYEAPGLEGSDKEAWANRMMGSHIARMEMQEPQKFQSLTERFIGTRRTETNPAMSDRDQLMQFVAQKNSPAFATPGNG